MRAALAALVSIGCAVGPADAPSTRQFVIAELETPAIGPDLRVPGFDLDHRVSDGTGPACIDEEDFISSVTGQAGVDNQLAANLRGTGPAPMDDGFRQLYLEAVAEGRWVLVLEVSSTSLVEDANAEVRLVVASSVGAPCDGAALVCPAGSICPADATPDMPATCGPRTASPIAPDDFGVVLADQPFATAELVAAAPASIHEGRLVAELDRFVLPMSMGDASTTLPIRDVRVEGTITAAGIDAEIGGGILVADFVAVAAALGLTGIDETTIRAVAVPDLAPDAAGECQAISMGMLLTAVTARVEP